MIPGLHRKLWWHHRGKDDAKAVLCWNTIFWLSILYQDCKPMIWLIQYLGFILHLTPKAISSRINTHQHLTTALKKGLGTRVVKYKSCKNLNMSFVFYNLLLSSTHTWRRRMHTLSQSGHYFFAQSCLDLLLSVERTTMTPRVGCCAFKQVREGKGPG